jgi:putative tryptophan/tyrosine transport system substrate-binding protein
VTTNTMTGGQDVHVGRYNAIRALVALALLALLWAIPLAPFAQTADKELHIGILSSGVLENRSPLDEALVQGLRDQGYIEGKNLVIERRYSSSKLRDNASELASMKLDAILTTCTPSTRIMKEATASTPIVMVAVSDPVQQGIIASLARPGQNVTGTSSQAEELLAKRLELLSSVIPKSTTIAVLADANNPVHALGWQRLESAAREMNLKLLKVELSKSDDLPAAVNAAVRAQAGALFVLPDDPLMFNLRPQIVALAAQNRMPDSYWAREYVDSGGLMSYGEDLRSSYRAGAGYMEKIKKGANPGELPVEQPTRYYLVINLKTAKTLGITIPQSLLLRADEVIQ